MDKIEQLLDATEHPERYSSAEIADLLSDPEVKEVFVLLDKTKSSLSSIDTPDVEAEWKAFELNHNKATISNRFKTLNLFSRNVAAGIAIGIASFAAVAAVVGVSVNYFSGRATDGTSPETETNIGVIVSQPDSIAAIEEMTTASPQIIVFDNKPLDTIISKVTAYYGYRLIFNADESRQLRLYFRWNQANSIDEVVESLNNFEQLHLSIENDTIKVD
ncbi:MAG: DUF4974 domain-containing protein [Muribaculaceae bacterium]|nr:DUF4974 domain-containing protein [Muribaculaceae bacterium]